MQTYQQKTEKLSVSAEKLLENQLQVVLMQKSATSQN